MEVEKFRYLPQSSSPKFCNHNFKENLFTKAQICKCDLLNFECTLNAEVVQCLSFLVQAAVCELDLASDKVLSVRSNSDETETEACANQNHSELPKWFYSPFDLTSWLKDSQYSCLTSAFHKACFQLGLELVIMRNSSNSTKGLTISDERIKSEELNEIHNKLSEINECYRLKQLVCTICNSYKTESLNVMEHHLLMPHYKDSKLRLMTCSQCDFRSSNHQEFFTHFLSQHQRVPYFIPFLHSQMCTRCPHEVNCRRSFLKHQEFCLKTWNEKNLASTNQAPTFEDEFDYIYKTAYPNFTNHHAIGAPVKEKEIGLSGENTNTKTRMTRPQNKVSLSRAPATDHVLVCPHCNGMLLSMEDFIMHMKRAHPGIPVAGEKSTNRITSFSRSKQNALTNGSSSSASSRLKNNSFHVSQNEQQYEMAQKNQAAALTTFALEISSLKSQFNDVKVSDEIDAIVSRLIRIYGCDEWMNTAQLLEVKSLSGECRKCMKGFILNIVEHQKNVHHRTLEQFGLELTCIICFQQFSSRGELIDHHYLSHHLVALCSLNRLYQIKINGTSSKNVPEKSQNSSRFHSPRNNQMPKKFFCKKCLVTGLDFSALCNHLELVHDVGVKVMRHCEICGAKFSRGSEMNSHQRSHLLKCRVNIKRITDATQSTSHSFNEADNNQTSPRQSSPEVIVSSQQSSPEVIVLDDS